MGIFARSLGLARVTPAVGGYAFMYPHLLSGLFSTISSYRSLALHAEPPLEHNFRSPRIRELMV
jgi:hypothetical protein